MSEIRDVALPGLFDSTGNVASDFLGLPRFRFGVVCVEADSNSGVRLRDEPLVLDRGLAGVACRFCVVELPADFLGLPLFLGVCCSRSASFKGMVNV